MLFPAVSISDTHSTVTTADSVLSPSSEASPKVFMVLFVVVFGLGPALLGSVLFFRFPWACPSYLCFILPIVRNDSGIGLLGVYGRCSPCAPIQKKKFPSESRPDQTGRVTIHDIQALR